jgi:hypothetical protein
VFEGFEDNTGGTFVGADDDGTEEVGGGFTAEALRRRGGIKSEGRLKRASALLGLVILWLLEPGAWGFNPPGFGEWRHAS